VGWLLAIIIAVCGWLYNSYRQRRLQRRQIAVDLLSQNRFEEAWVAGLAAVFKVIANNPNYDWTAIAVKRYSHGQVLEGDDLVTFEHLKCVLNYLEFIAVAVLNRAADENIVRWSFEPHYLKLSSAMGGYIAKVRELVNDDNIFINLTTLADRWKKKPQPARPTR